ncbi:MAG: DNA translocase FtsK 4TM domain-containing protein, partial [Phycisphaerales bacterium]
MPKTARKAANADHGAAESDPSLNRRRMIWVLCAASWTFLAASLASFQSADWPTHVVAVPNDPPLNLCGRFGAAIAYALYFTFGVAVWLPMIYLGVLLVAMAMGRAVTHPFVRFVGCLVAMAAFGGLHAEWFPSAGSLTGVDAGIVPMWFADELHGRFGPVGASILFLAALSIGAIVTADALVAMLPGALARAFAFLSPIWEADWKGAFAAMRERFSAMFPQPAVAGAGRSRRGARAAAAATATKRKAAVVDADEVSEADSDEEEVTPASTAASAPTAHTTAARAPLSEDELRAKIEKLPIKMTAKPAVTKLRDEDIPRTPDYSGYQFPTLELLEEPEGNYSAKMEAYVRAQA